MQVAHAHAHARARNPLPACRPRAHHCRYMRKLVRVNKASFEKKRTMESIEKANYEIRMVSRVQARATAAI